MSIARSLVLELAADKNSFLSLLPKLGPLQMVCDFLARHWPPWIGAVETRRDVRGSFLYSFGSGTGSATSRVAFNQPRDAIFAANGETVIVADCNNHRCLEFPARADYTGAVTRVFGEKQTGCEKDKPGYIGCPFGVSLSPTGHLFASGSIDHRLHLFKLSGEIERSFASAAESPAWAPKQPWHVAVNAAAVAAVADSGNRRVTFWRLPLCIPIGVMSCARHTPRGVAWSPDGHLLYVSDSGNYVSKYLTSVDDSASDPHDSVNTTLICSWGGKKAAADGLDTPDGLAVDANGNVIVCDLRGHRLAIFAHDGTFLREVRDTTDAKKPTRMHFPSGVGVNARGEMVVAHQCDQMVSVWK